MDKQGKYTIRNKLDSGNKKRAVKPRPPWPVISMNIKVDGYKPPRRRL